MATLDITRYATHFRKHYTGLRMQQGRVLTDDDFNEHARLEAEDRRRTRVDVIGPAGSPDQGFVINKPVIDATTKLPTFTITKGSFYLGGQRLVLEADEPALLQKDWLDQGAAATDWPAAPAAQRYDLAYLEAWQQPVAAVEDTELQEIALGIPDTSGRIRNLRRVRLFPDTGSADCGQSWAALLTSRAAEGTLDGGFEFVPDAKLKLESTGNGGSGDLCSPPVAGGYLGAENQTIRVQITGPGEFTWGFDNAAPLYRVQLGTDDHAQKRRITMLTEPRDQAHWPLAGQVVELLPWSAVLPNGQKLSELHGFLAQVTAAFDPTAKTFDIDLAPPNDASGQAFGETWKTRGDQASLANEGEFFYLRVWNRGSDTASKARIPFAAGTAVPLGQTGLQATFSGSQLRPDDFWIIAVRPDSPTTFMPWDVGADPNDATYPGRRPTGVRRWLAPLAVINWPGGGADGTVANDCRDTFLPLTQIQTCCTVTVGDGNQSHGHFTSIQDAIASLPAAGGRVCVLPGAYRENIRILNPSHVVISGCGSNTLIQSAPPAAGATGADPVIHVIGGADITIESLVVQADPTGAGIVIEGLNPFLSSPQDAQGAVEGVVLRDLHVTGGAWAAVSARFVNDLVIRDSVFDNPDASTLEHTVVVLADDALITGNVIEVNGQNPGTGGAGLAGAAGFSPGANADGGLHIEGTSERVRVIDNLIRGGVGQGITLGTVVQLDSNGDPVPIAAGGVSSPDPCAARNPGNTFIGVEVGGSGANQTQTGSLGALYDIRIERNRIYEMGLCGLGVMGFFDLSKADEFISVERLAILGNDLSNNLWRPLAPIDPAQVDSMGYGGIALADVSDLIIRDNSLTDNGLSSTEPVCGVFVLHAEGLELSRNRISDGGQRYLSSGAAAEAPTSGTGAPAAGRRGGINIVYALPPVLPAGLGIVGTGGGLIGQNGVPAAKIHENVVSATLGQALSLMGVGPMSVLGNQFTSRGVVEAGASLLAATVGILNLGLSAEIYLELIAFAVIANGGLDVSSTSGVLSQPAPGLDDAGIGRLLANGNVLFSENQCVLDLIGAAPSMAMSSVAIVSLDDIHFHGNQCDCNLLLDLVLTQVFLFGFSLRANDNRFKEGWFNAFFSVIALGIMASAVGNQATHCLLVRGYNAALTKNDPASNIMLIRGFLPKYCQPSAELSRTFGQQAP